MLVMSLLLSGLAWADAIPRIQSRFTLPPLSFLMTPYFDGEALVVHLQSKQENPQVQPVELLIDARTGRPWAGEFASLIGDRGRRLGLEMPADLTGVRGRANREVLEALGCAAKHNRGCSLPEDADVLLFSAFDKAHSALHFEVVDLRPLLNGMTHILSGQADWKQMNWTATDWQVLDALSRLPEWRNVWLDALRSVADPTTFAQLRQNYDGLHLGRRIFLKDSLDVQGEMELAGFRLLVQQHARSWLQDPAEQQMTELAEVVAVGLAPPSQGRVGEHMAQALVTTVPPDRLPGLAESLARQARSRHSEDLRCFSAALMERSCRSAMAQRMAAPRAARPAVSTPQGKAAPKPASPITARPVEREPVAEQKDGLLGGIVAAAPKGQRSPVRVADNVYQEVVMIEKLPNQAVLMAFGEAKGRLDKDAASIAGLTFVARVLGTVQDGRFDVQVSPARIAPMRLSQGSYRAKVRLVLNYTREDRCQRRLNCLVTESVEHVKTEQRDVTFRINVGNGYGNVQPVSFGSLLPLIADGSALYSSRLKSVRLSIKNVLFALE